MPCGHRTFVNTSCGQQAHTEHASIEETLNTGIVELLKQALVTKSGILNAEMVVR
jgi:hypothetical protein